MAIGSPSPSSILSLILSSSELQPILKPIPIKNKMEIRFNFFICLIFMVIYWLNLLYPFLSSNPRIPYPNSWDLGFDPHWGYRRGRHFLYNSHHYPSNIPWLPPLFDSYCHWDGSPSPPLLSYSKNFDGHHRNWQIPNFRCQKSDS